MSTTVSTFPRDANRVPITQLGTLVTKSLALTANNTTVNPPIFTVTGTVLVNAIYGIVTTAIGTNNTAAALRINDQTAQVYLTLLAGTTLSAAPVGSLIMKTGLVGAAITLKSSAAGAVLESTTLDEMPYSPIIIIKKATALTQIEFKYTTTDTPTTGVIKFYCDFIPLSDDGDVSPT